MSVGLGCPYSSQQLSLMMFVVFEIDCVKDFVMWEVNKMLEGRQDPRNSFWGHGTAEQSLCGGHGSVGDWLGLTWT